MQNALICNGEISTSFEGVAHCSSNWELLPIVEPFDIEQLDPAVLGQFFGVGFTLVATALLIGIGASTVLDFIKRA